MDTRKVAAKHRLAHWAQLMSKRAESGLSVKAFCEDTQIPENTYYYWQRKLREKACELSMSQGEESQASLVPQRFMEVKMRSQQAQDYQKAMSSQIQIECAGIRLSADSTYPADNLAILLRELVRL